MLRELAKELQALLALTPARTWAQRQIARLLKSYEIPRQQFISPRGTFATFKLVAAGLHDERAVTCPHQTRCLRLPKINFIYPWLLSFALINVTKRLCLISTEQKSLIFPHQRCE